MLGSRNASQMPKTMYMYIRFLLRSLPFLLIGLASCNAFEYHPYDVNVKGPTGLNAKNIASIEMQCYQKDTIRFALMGDAQRWYDDSNDFVDAINKRNDLDFVINPGDMTDFGLTREYEWMRDIMLRLKIPFVAIIGNHDILGNGSDTYHLIYGAENFSFVAGNTKFVCLNTNALEYDYSHPVPDFSFLKQELLHPSGTTRTVAAMHVKPGDEQFNNNVQEVFHEYLKKFPDFCFAVHSHNHAINKNDIFGDGIMYYGEANIKQRHYFVFTLTPSRYSYEENHF